jgi:hypothetical protein
MIRNLAERIGPLSSRTGRFPWLFPSLNLDRSHNELATAWRRVEILYASRPDRIWLWKAEVRSQKQEVFPEIGKKRKEEGRMELMGISDIEGSELATGRVRPIGGPDWHFSRDGSDEGAREASEFQLRGVEHCAAAIRDAAVAGEFLF